MASPDTATPAASQVNQRIDFATSPEEYRHWRLEVDDTVARLTMQVQEDAPLYPGYELKLNSYDLGVDIELYDAVQRLRFEHPEADHALKVNFCKFTNETRNSIEDASAHSGQRYICAVNWPAAGGGYELALACDHIILIDDGSSTVALPELPLLAVLPGTGGLTRLVDKRRAYDDLLLSIGEDWLAREITLYLKRTLKRLDVSSRSLVALVEPGSCFAGTLLELALAADRCYMLDGVLDDDEEAPTVRLTEMNFGPLPMVNGVTRAEGRFLDPEELRDHIGRDLDAEAAHDLGLVTFIPDDIDWEDEVHRIPNNVGLSDNRRLQRALESWQANYMKWWHDMGPDGSTNFDVYLRTAISVETDGWANFGFVKMPEYRWGIFLAKPDSDRVISFGDHRGEPVWQEVPGEYRAPLRRLIVTQGDTEPASVEQQRRLGLTCPSLYDLRNLFQINVEEGRHLWAMVYLLHAYFGRDGREEAEAMLERHSGDADRPRILGAFNEETPNGCRT
ncbi:Benzoyl-CoA oxygenase component B [Geodia barretti]|uniref:Benzoyl-CoA oxygenase component B n=1 Tax=Geodia barretti TaxID=519541 RepID=A0AA35TWN5_GEOBA|nr:Benzoyl-CoA oxygenase component B [Geodia barretti]